MTPPLETFKGEKELRKALKDDFPFYSSTALKIVPKYGSVEGFALNKAQEYIHKQLERQSRDAGKVRALILKARQMGCSTYIAGRYYWKVTQRKGVNAYVLSHAIDTTKKLFSMTRRFQENCPEIVFQETRAASSTELSFEKMDSSYYVGTAGSKETGRGGTVHYFHGSEVAFWGNADTHFAGVIQSVPGGLYAQDTEIILESTGNGMGGKFYELWCEAEKGFGDYIPIFTPWQWQYEYQTPPPKGWSIEDSSNKDLKEEMEFLGITVDQAYWMHNKRIELGDSWLFKQEYPATSEEAFQSPGDSSYIPHHLALEASLEKPDIEEIGAKVGACDPARFGKDATGIGYRTGRVFNHVELFFNMDTMETAGRCKKYIAEHGLDRMFVDTNGIGAGVYDRLVEDGYRKVVRPVNFGESAILNDIYCNKRAECWGEMRKWLEDKPAQIPNYDFLRRDLTAPQYGYDSRTRLKLESKDDMKRRGVDSPNAADVLAMTFAEPVTPLLHHGSDSVKVIRDYDILDY